jgi:hypothetical protein
VISSNALDLQAANGKAVIASPGQQDADSLHVTQTQSRDARIAQEFSRGQHPIAKRAAPCRDQYAQGVAV